MKKLENLTRDECQELLDSIFHGKVEYTNMLFDINIDECGIEYRVKDSDKKSMIPFSDVGLIIWLYEHNVDLSIPLRQLKIEQIELNETNSLLFEYSMEINKIINDLDLSEDHIYDRDDGRFHARYLEDYLCKIKKLQKELVNKL